MSPGAAGEVTELLQAWTEGDAAALEQLIPRVHRELHRIAKRYMAGESPGHTLEPTALINEAYIRLVDWKNVRWNNRCHFFAVSAQMMRKVLIDHARARAARKRGGPARRTTLNSALLAGHQGNNMDLLILDSALDRLTQLDPRKSRVVELRIFGGLTIEETAEAMELTVITVRRDWQFALAWLRKELGAETSNGS
jgi:RNA polymerase sigma factor (TIGR02999 family)